MIRLRGLTWRTRRGHDPLVAAAQAFSARHPEVAIEWESLPWLEFAAEQRRALSSADGRYDLVMFDQPWTGDYAAAGWLAPLDDLVPDDVLTACAHDAGWPSWSAYRHDDRQWGLPVDAAAQTMTWRPDLVEGGPEVDGDWDDVLGWAASARRAGGPSAFVTSFAPVNVMLLFLSIGAALDGRPYDRPEAGLDPGIGAASLALLARIYRRTLPAAELGDRLPFDVLARTGRAAAAPAAFPYPDAYVADPLRPMSVRPMPAMPETGRATSALGGVGLGVCATSPAAVAAAAFAAYAMSPQIQGGPWVTAGGLPGSRSALRGPAMRAAYGDLGDRLADLVSDCYVRPHWPGWSWVERAAGEALLAHLGGHTGAAETLHAVDAIALAGPDHALAAA